MLVHLDNSVLVDAFTTPHRSTAALLEAISKGDALAYSTIVLYEWLRGPRTDQERRDASLFFGSSSIAAFGPDEAATAARLYRQVPGARRRQADIAIAACALEHGAALWTLNPGDFEDIPGLKLYRP